MHSSRSRNRFASLGVLILALTALLLGVAGCGGGGGGGGSAQNVVAGIVLDSRQQDEPVGGATVSIGGVTATTVTVDQANASNPVGSFRMENVPVGTDRAIVTAPGQQPQTIVFAPPVAAGTNPTLELIINIGQITGQVLGPDGQPASGAFVSESATGQLVETDPNGRFLIDLVPLGPTEVSAVLGTASVAKPVTVVDGVTDVGVLTLVDDPNPNPPGNPATIVGKVTLGDTGGLGAGTFVILFRNGVQLEQKTADAGGNFDFYVPANNYTIRFLNSAYADQEVAVTVSNPNQPVRADVTLQLR